MAAILRGEAAWHPARTVVPLPQWLPSAERRRTNTVVKLALAVGREAVDAAAADAAQLLTVFTSSGAGGDAPIAGGGVVNGIVEAGWRQLALFACQCFADLMTILAVGA